jgi:uncharacterized RDD family membrane protein YckC
VEYAGFWPRLGALLIDQILLSVAAFIVGFVIGFIVGASGGDLTNGLVWAINVIVIVGYYLYYAIMESSPAQATVGKQALGIQVTDLEGNRISFWRALGRNLAKIVSVLTLFIGYLMAGFTARKQALHDLIASTLVVKKATAPAPTPTEQTA